jgi:hypothetical protein
LETTSYQKPVSDTELVPDPLVALDTVELVYVFEFPGSNCMGEGALGLRFGDEWLESHF